MPTAVARRSRRPVVSIIVVIVVLIAVGALAGRNRSTADADADPFLASVRAALGSALAAPDTYRLTMDLSSRVTERMIPVAPCGGGYEWNGRLAMVVDPEARVAEVLDERRGMVRQIITADARYFSKDAAPTLPVPAPWIRAGDDRAGHELGYSLDPLGLGTFDGFDPRILVEQIQQSATSAVDVGREDVDGVPTRHLRITVDQQRFATAALEHDRRAGVGPGTTMTPASTLPAPPEGSSSTIETWIDDRGRLRRLAVRLVAAAPPGSPSEIRTIESTGRFEFRDAGTPLPVPVPSGNQVVDATDVSVRVFAPGGRFGTCATTVPADVPHDIAQGVRDYETCINDRVVADLDGHSIADVAWIAAVQPRVFEHQQACLPITLARWCTPHRRSQARPHELERWARWCAWSDATTGPAPPHDPTTTFTTGTRPPAGSPADRLAAVLTMPPPKEQLDEAQLEVLRGILVGMPEGDARQLLESIGWILWDLEHQPFDENFIPNRLYVRTGGGRVTAVVTRN